MRIAFEVVAILERSRLALVDVDRHQPRRGLGAHDLPLASRPESPRRQGRAAPTISSSAMTASTLRSAVEACRARSRTRPSARYCRVVDVAPEAAARPRGLRSPARPLAAVARSTGLRPTTAAGACSQRPMHGAPITRTPGPSVAASSARQRVGRPPSGRTASRKSRTVQRRRWRLAFLHDVEVMVERRDLVHLGHREPHFLRQRDDVRSRNAAVGVLNPVQMLDQEVAPPRRVAEQRAHLGQRLRIDSAALGSGRAARRACATARIRS